MYFYEVMPEIKNCLYLSKIILVSVENKNVTYSKCYFFSTYRYGNFKTIYRSRITGKKRQPLRNMGGPKVSSRERHLIFQQFFFLILQ